MLIPSGGYLSLIRPLSQPQPDPPLLWHPGQLGRWIPSHPERFANKQWRDRKKNVVKWKKTKHRNIVPHAYKNTYYRLAETWEEAQMRSCSLLAPAGGVILLKRPVRRRGVGTNKVFCACREDKTFWPIKHHCSFFFTGYPVTTPQSSYLTHNQCDVD